MNLSSTTVVTGIGVSLVGASTAIAWFLGKKKGKGQTYAATGACLGAASVALVAASLSKKWGSAGEACWSFGY